MPALTTIKVRRGTAAGWTAANPTLAAGEPGYETDTGKMKVGDGATAWNSLAYFTGSGGVTGFATPAIALGTAAAAGAAATVIRSDATIAAFDATTPAAEAFGASGATGSATVAARRDHVHAMPADPTGKPMGLTGATAATRYVGATTSGAPLSGTFAVGDFIIDQTPKVWVCTVAGSPGTWTQVGGGSSSPLTTKGDLWGFSTIDARIPIGTDAYVLTADSTQPLGLKWAASASGFADPTTTKGDLIVHGTSTTRMGVGTDGQVLTADSTQTLGVKWGAASGGGVLGAISYSSGVNGVWHSTNSSTVSDIDATNAALTITVPASGKIVVMIEAEVWETIAGGQCLIGLRTGTTTLATRTTNQSATSIASPSQGPNYSMLTGPLWFYLTGLTPGSLTIKAAWAASGSGGATVNVAAYDGASGHDNPFVMVAWAA